MVTRHFSLTNSCVILSIPICRALKSIVVSSGITSVPNYVRICQIVQTFGRGGGLAGT
jgi:hypothetical protein